jgi:hypothetical protein
MHAARQVSDAGWLGWVLRANISKALCQVAPSSLEISAYHRNAFDRISLKSQRSRAPSEPVPHRAILWFLASRVLEFLTLILGQ